MRKHRAAYRRFGRGFVARANWKFAKLSARYALNNRSYVAALGYLGRAVAENPRYAAFKVRQRLLA